MSHTTKIVLASLAMIIAATGIAAAGGPNFPYPAEPKPTIHPSADVMHSVNNAVLGRDEASPSANSVEVLVAVDCSVKGDDLRLANAGDDILPAGTRIKWKALDATGVIKLTAPLLAGRSFQMADLLDNAAEDCSAKVV